MTLPSSWRARKVSPGWITASMVLSLFIMKLQSPSCDAQPFQLGVDQQLLHARDTTPISLSLVLTSTTAMLRDASGLRHSPFLT
jgi:hypothetical protein